MREKSRDSDLCGGRCPRREAVPADMKMWLVVSMRLSSFSSPAQAFLEVVFPAQAL